MKSDGMTTEEMHFQQETSTRKVLSHWQHTKDDLPKPVIPPPRKRASNERLRLKNESVTGDGLQMTCESR
jgi:hypothetical protein